MWCNQSIVSFNKKPHTSVVVVVPLVVVVTVSLYKTRHCRKKERNMLLWLLWCQSIVRQIRIGAYCSGCTGSTIDTNTGHSYCQRLSYQGVTLKNSYRGNNRSQNTRGCNRGLALAMTPRQTVVLEILVVVTTVFVCVGKTKQRKNNAKVHDPNIIETCVCGG